MAKTINKSKNRGFTLTETLTVMVIFSIIALTIGAYFVNEYELRTSIIKRAQMTREARVALRHLTSKLRFARPDTVSITKLPNRLNIQARIKGGHLQHYLHEDEIRIQYTYTNHNGQIEEIYLSSPAGPGPVILPIIAHNKTVIARDIASFDARLSGDNNDYLTLQIAVEVDDKLLEIETGVKMLGELQQ